MKIALLFVNSYFQPELIDYNTARSGSNSVWSLELVIWTLFVIWYLVLGIYRYARE